MVQWEKMSVQATIHRNGLIYIYFFLLHMSISEILPNHFMYYVMSVIFIDLTDPSLKFSPELHQHVSSYCHGFIIIITYVMLHS